MFIIVHICSLLSQLVSTCLNCSYLTEFVTIVWTCLYYFSELVHTCLSLFIPAWTCSYLSQHVHTKPVSFWKESHLLFWSWCIVITYYWQFWSFRDHLPSICYCSTIKLKRTQVLKLKFITTFLIGICLQGNHFSYDLKER